MRINIRAKVLLTVSLSLILIFTLIGILLVHNNTDNLRSNLNEQSQSFAALSAKPIGDTFVLYKESGSLRITRQVNNFLDLNPDIIAIRIISVDGTQLYDSLDRNGRSIDESLASAFEPQYIHDESGYIEKIVQPYFEDSGARRYSIVYEISSQRIEQNIREVVTLIIYAGALILAISILITGFILNNLFIKPINEVSRSANIISSGKFDHKIISKRQDEIGDLAQSVEKMADYLKADIAKLRDLDKLKSEFMMIASHNLRTPISIIQEYADMAKNSKTTGDLKSIIKTIKENVVRLNLLSEDVLTISTLETGDFVLRKSPVQLHSYLQSISNEFMLLAEKKNINWSFDNSVPEDAQAELSQANVRSALANLLDNAIKFTDTGGSVSIKCEIADGQFVFQVKDTGIGISKDEMGKLFTKFHRGTDTLNYTYEGAGIGLYLTKLIVEQHGGKVEVQSTPGKGSVFTVYIPVA